MSALEAYPPEEPPLFVALPVAGTDRRFVACSRCGEGYLAAAKTLRDMRRDARLPVCKPCRLGEPVPEPLPDKHEPTEQDYRYWMRKLLAGDITFEFVVDTVAMMDGNPPVRRRAA